MLRAVLGIVLGIVLSIKLVKVPFSHIITGCDAVAARPFKFEDRNVSLENQYSLVKL